MSLLNFVVPTVTNTLENELSLFGSLISQQAKRMRVTLNYLDASWLANNYKLMAIMIDKCGIR